MTSLALPNTRWPALAGLLFLFTIIFFEVHARQAILLLVGAGLGAAMLAGSFGFAGSWRLYFKTGDGRGIRAQLWVIAATATLFIPLIAYFPDQLRGAIAPVGVSLLVGAVLFSIGMQLANGCASGTLFALGGGSIRSSFALIGFIAGAFWASLDMGFWLALPKTQPIAMANLWGWPLALLATWVFVICGLLFFRETKSWQISLPFQRLPFTGSWSWTEAGIILIILNLCTLLLAGHPWSVTYGFTLWGAKFAQIMGVDLSTVPFWTWQKGQQALEHSVLTEVSSVMNIGMLLGASAYAAFAQKTVGPSQLPIREMLIAIVGGLLMGYGARLSFGCNIGAFLGGTASGSIHGWLWFLIAFVSTPLGIKLRYFLGMER
ncbi:MAG: YeeE/YedE family protein [Alphaproteobacteria bacterium]